MSLQDQFEAFHHTIELNRDSPSYLEAKKKDEVIYKKIKNSFKKAGYDIERTEILGSMGTHTGVQPLEGDRYNINRAVFITQASSPDDPVKIKKLVKKILQRNGFTKAHIKNPCITANALRKPLSISYVIYQEDWVSGIKIAIGKEHSSDTYRIWDTCDPDGLKKWLTWKDTWIDVSSIEQQQFYRLVRYMKRWRDHQYQDHEADKQKIFSICLTIMVHECMYFSFDTNEQPHDHIALKNTVKKILSNAYFTETSSSQNQSELEYDICVKLPKDPYRDIFNGRGRNIANLFYQKLNQLLLSLEQVSKEKNLTQQCEILRQELGTDFPLATTTTTNNTENERSDNGEIQTQDTHAKEK